MILVDTQFELIVSTWKLGAHQIIGDDRLHCHPFVVGGLALGSLRERDTVTAFLAAQREAMIATHAEVMTVIDRYAIFSMWLRLH